MTPYRSSWAIKPRVTSIKPIIYSIISTSGWLRCDYKYYLKRLIMLSFNALYTIYDMATKPLFSLELSSFCLWSGLR